MQQIKDIYLFGVVAVLLVCDIVFMLPPTIISSSILRREERELEGRKVSGHHVHALKNCCMHITVCIQQFVIIIIVCVGWRSTSDNWRLYI